MNAEHQAFASQLDKLIQARPEHALVRVFVPASQRDAISAFEALVFELEQTVWHAREAAVAAVKLNWWGEELQRTADGTPRHPVTQHLPAIGDAPSFLAAVREWIAVANRLLDGDPRGDFAAQHSAVEAFYAPLARIDAAVFGRGKAAAAPRATSFLLRELGRLAFGQDVHALAIPANLLARHQVARDALGLPGAAREAVLRDQLDALVATMPAAPGPTDGGFPVRLRQRLDRQLALRAHAAAEPSSALRAGLKLGPATAWHTWREARRGL